MPVSRLVAMGLSESYRKVVFLCMLICVVVKNLWGLYENICPL